MLITLPANQSFFSYFAYSNDQWHDIWTISKNVEGSIILIVDFSCNGVSCVICRVDFSSVIVILVSIQKTIRKFKGKFLFNIILFGTT